MTSWWRWIALAAAVAGIALFVDVSTVVEGVRAIAADPLPLTLALVAYTVGFALRAAAWGPLIPVRTAWRRRLRALLAMLAVNHTLPGPVGEVVRGRAIAGPDLPFRRALLTVVAARVVDVFAVGVLLGSSALLAGEAPTWVRWAAPLAVLLPLAAAAVARRRGADLRLGALTRAAGWALPSWLVEAGVVLVVARAAGVEISLAGAVLVTCASLIAQVAAVTPGGIGTYEFGMTTGLVALGVPAADALAVAVVTHGIKFIYALAVGLPALVPWRSGVTERPVPA